MTEIPYTLEFSVTAKLVRTAPVARLKATIR